MLLKTLFSSPGVHAWGTEDQVNIQQPPSGGFWIGFSRSRNAEQDFSEAP